MDQMFVHPLKFICWNPNPPSVAVFGGEAFRKYLGLDEAMKMGPPWWD